MASGFHDIWASISSWFQGLDVREVLKFLGEKLLEGVFQAVAVVVIGWLVLYRQWRQLTQGRSDQVVFSANLLTPIGEPAGRGRSLPAPAPDRAAAPDGRPAPGQRGAAAGDPQPGRAGQPRRPDPRDRGDGRLRDRQRHRQQRGREPGLRIVPARPVAAGRDLRGSEGRPQVLHPGAADPSRRSRPPGVLGLVPRARPGRGMVPLLADRHPPPDRAPLPGGTGAAEGIARRGHQGEPAAAGRSPGASPASPPTRRWASTSTSRSSSRPSPSTGCVIYRRSPSWD